MNIVKPQGTVRSQTADGSRRSFFVKLGAGVAGAAASAAGIAGSGAVDSADLSLRVALLEEEKALRKLHQAFEQALDGERYDDVIENFTDDAKVVFNGGIFDNRNRGISRLYRDRFRAGKTGRRMEPAPGFEVDAGQQHDSVDVSPDLLSATAIFPYSIRVGVPIRSDTSLASMARLQGNGVKTWWEGGVYRVTYRRDDASGRWRIGRLEYDTLSRADYRSGRTHATATVVEPISVRYPEDPHGPDALV